MWVVADLKCVPLSLTVGLPIFINRKNRQFLKAENNLDMHSHCSLLPNDLFCQRIKISFYIMGCSHVGDDQDPFISSFCIIETFTLPWPRKLSSISVSYVGQSPHYSHTFECLPSRLKSLQRQETWSEVNQGFLGIYLQYMDIYFKKNSHGC